MPESTNTCGILYVDDEGHSLKYFREAFDDIAPVFTAGDGEEGLRVFEEHRGEIGVILSDKRMPGMSGVEFLERVRGIDEEPLRILVTAYSDLNLAVECLNDGLIFSYLTKPWDPEDIRMRVRRALDRFWIKRERTKLLKQRSTAVRKMIMAEKVSNIRTLSLGLNHHMRNAMTVVQSFVDMVPLQLKEELEGAPKDTFFWNDYYENVVEQISRVMAILESISGAPEGGDEEEGGLCLSGDVDLVHLIREAGESELSDCPGIRFEVAAAGSVPLIDGDEARLKRLTSLLIKEIVKNLGDEGRIEARVSASDCECCPGAEVRVLLLDDGPPLPERDRVHLFDPFHVRSDRPSDLGTDLLAAYLIVYQHGGIIHADRASDGRNAIEFALPKRHGTKCSSS